MTYAEIWWQMLLLALGAYLIGNFNFSVLISKLKKKDVRTMGSGNPGTMNMLRNFGALVGGLTLVLDILKGAVPCIIAYFVFSVRMTDGFLLGDMALYIAGFSVVLGHIYPVFMKFKGGKGVATTFGVFFVANPLWMGIGLIVTILFIVIFQYGGLADLLVIGGITVIDAVHFNAIYMVGSVVPIGLMIMNCFMAAICLITFFAHRKNIHAMLAGTEHKTNLRRIIAKIFKKKKKKTQAAN